MTPSDMMRAALVEVALSGAAGDAARQAHLARFLEADLAAGGAAGERH
ncbi:MAG: hypothetical protein R3D02_15870 [Hyphomicrobiales bacterium]